MDVGVEVREPAPAGDRTGSDALVDSAWSLAWQSLRRPYPLSASTAVLMAALFLMAPFYIFIAELMPGREMHTPELAVDRLVPLQPAWALVYGSLYLFLILLPLFVVRQPDQIRRTVLTYLAVWSTAFVFFLLYPTSAPRPGSVAGSGFVVWGLKFLYESDPPYNCFPSLHVAHSTVSALTCYLVNRGVGIVAFASVVLVGVSTLFTKQHYVLDVMAGILLAGAAFLLLFRGHPRDAVPELDRRAAPALAAAILGILALVAAGFWIAFRVNGNG
jgi:membrane-associated phospholipid phosphatase